jgi:uncharacterized protein YlzI (FlbEa/FlbD family)
MTAKMAEFVVMDGNYNPTIAVKLTQIGLVEPSPTDEWCVITLTNGRVFIVRGCYDCVLTKIGWLEVPKPPKPPRSDRKKGKNGKQTS